jgi:hypothetical protein
MKIRMNRTLREYINDVYQDVRLGGDGTVRRRKGVLARILGDLESEGDAMRYVDARGRVAWRATPACGLI